MGCDDTSFLSGGAQQFLTVPTYFCVPLRTNISNYLSLCLCHAFHKENEASPVAISLSREKANGESLQEKWERASFFTEYPVT